MQAGPIILGGRDLAVTLAAVLPAWLADPFARQLAAPLPLWAWPLTSFGLCLPETGCGGCLSMMEALCKLSKILLALCRHNYVCLCTESISW